jgi:hypothetical protein
MWRLDLTALRDAAASIAAQATGAGGTTIAVGSPRTPAKAWAVVRDAAPDAAFADSEVRYAVLLADADQQFVTADSVSMVSEAVMTGKPVGMIPVEPDSRGRRHLAGHDPQRTRLRDPRRFWAEVEQRGLVGSVDAPRSGHWEDPVATAVARVRARLGSLFE